MSDQVVVERQCLDKASEVATWLLTKRTRALSIQTRELKITRKGVSKLYKITFAHPANILCPVW